MTSSTGGGPLEARTALGECVTIWVVYYISESESEQEWIRYVGRLASRTMYCSFSEQPLRTQPLRTQLC